MGVARYEDFELALELVEIPENPAPPGAKIGWLKTADGSRLRTALWFPAAGQSRGTIVLLGGRSEFIEKYFETIGELLARGFAVATMDWRGQGLSDRLLVNPRKGHIDDFATFDRDLAQFMEEVVAAEMPLPWVALAHSMGGHLALRAAHDHLDWFAALILSAPMLGLKLGGKAAQAALRVYVKTACALGGASAYVPGGGPKSAVDIDFADNFLTSDVRRYVRTQAIERERPDLALGAATVGWLNAAFASIDQLAEAAYLGSVRMPVLMVEAEEDALITSSSLRWAAQWLPHAELLTVGDARHEILMERDELRRRFWAAFDRFIEKNFGQRLD